MKNLLFVLLLALVLSSCGGATNEAVNSTEPVELLYFHGKNEIVAGLQEMADAFNESNPEYNVVMDMAGGDFVTVVQGKFAAGNLPAMLTSYDYSEMQLKNYLDNDIILPVEDLELFDVVNDSHEEGLRFSDGHIYGVPILLAGKGLMYNEGLFEKAGIVEVPTTADELWAACEKLEAIGVIPFVGGHQDLWTLAANAWRTFYDQNAPENFTQDIIDGKVNFADEIVPKWIAWLDKYVEYSAQPILQINWGTALGMLATEEAAMVINGPWTIQSVNEMAPDVGAKFRMIGNLTTNDPSKNLLIEDVDQHMLLINTTPEVIEGSKKFLNWMVTSDEAREIFARSIRGPNPNGIEYEGTPVDNDIARLGAEGKSKFGQTGLNHPKGWADEIGIQTQKYLNGELSAEELGAVFDETWDRMYADL